MGKVDPKLINLIKFFLFYIGPLLSAFIYIPLKFSQNVDGKLEDWVKYLGAFATLKIGYHVLKAFYFHFLKPVKDLRKYGKWAVITGATSGIGEAYAHYLAQLGINILLISRSETKLRKVASDLSQYGVETEYLIHDFAKDDKEYVAKFRSTLDEKLGDLTSRGGVGVLINSVGVANDIPTHVHEMDPEDVRQMLYINNDGTMLMMTSVVPHMMFRKSGAIITISSASCTHPAGLLTVYSATKAFGHQLARSMYYEYKEHGIDSLSITPYYFVSNLFVRSKGTILAPMPNVIIEKATKYLGYAAEANPYWAHKLLNLLFTQYIFGHEEGHKVMKRSRKRALSKMAKQKEQ